MKLFKYLFYLFAFIYLLLFFLPKSELYYKSEELLSKKEIYINDEIVKEKPFGLNIKGAKVIYESLLVGGIKEIDADIFLFYNSLELKGVNLRVGALKFIPKNAKEIKITYSIKDVKRVYFSAISDIGEIKGSFNLFKQKISVFLKRKKGARYNEILRYFKKDKKGEYRYEKTFKLY